MLFTPVTVAASVPAAEPGNPGRARVLEAYAAALRRCGAVVEAAGADELVFRVPLGAGQARLSLAEADIGLVSGGTLEVVAGEAGWRVVLRARPRAWFVALALAPWLLLLWGLGVTPAPWRYLFVLGGVPLFIIMWVVATANLRAFLDQTNRTLSPHTSPDGAREPRSG